MKLDICAPQVIFPDDFQSGDPLLVVVDLGRILLTNSESNASNLLLLQNETNTSFDVRDYNIVFCFACFSLLR